MQCFILEQITQKVNYIYPPLIFFNLLSSPFSSAVLSEPPNISRSCCLFPSNFCPSVACWSLLAAAEWILLQYDWPCCPDAHLPACTFTHTHVRGGDPNDEGVLKVPPLPSWHPQWFKELKATWTVSTAGAGRVFLGQTWDQDSPLLSDPGVCLSSSDRGRGTEEMVDVGVL